MKTDFLLFGDASWEHASSLIRCLYWADDSQIGHGSNKSPKHLPEIDFTLHELELVGTLAESLDFVYPVAGRKLLITDQPQHSTSTTRHGGLGDARNPNKVIGFPVATMVGSGAFLGSHTPNTHPGAIGKTRRLSVETQSPRSTPKPSGITAEVNCVPCSNAAPHTFSKSQERRMNELRLWDSTSATAAAPGFIAPELIHTDREQGQDCIPVDVWDFANMDALGKSDRNREEKTGLDVQAVTEIPLAHPPRKQLATLPTSTTQSPSLSRLLTSLRQSYLWSADGDQATRAIMAVH
ncbi:hypothetical protein B0T25DRAFT_248491 [Lasiosphaeria hispida]|uniref:Uncharacterized protein n=1 Tax=Lasiosphaeria hispida TaxID=260671 RepID=A0AAJ0HFJ0_9PEZI|nr:hypothetical protein B0T25DRAFT_248491 [Lasiosphaeria hispida]